MKIALCLEYPIAQRGGTEVLVHELAKGLSKQHHVILVSPDDGASVARAQIAPFVAEHVFFEPGWSSAAKSASVAEKIALTKPDIAHFHFGGTYGWGNRYPFRCPIYFLPRKNIPCLSTVHLVVSVLNGYCGPQKPLWFKLLMLPLAWLGKMQQLQCVSREIAVSQHDYHKLCRWYWPFRHRFAQIYHSRLAAIPQAATRNFQPIILNVGHIAWRKGQHVLAAAFAQIAARHPEWTLQLAGPCLEPSAAAQIRQIINQYQLQNRIILLGERSDALELMQRASIYVQPSFWEALGLALQEAMAVGCACIGSRAGGIPELIQHEKTGLLVEPGNVEQLAQSLERFIGDQNYRNQIGQAAASSIQERGMTSEQMVKRYLELYETMCRR